MADDIKRVGIEITAEGAKEFTASMKDIRAATKEAYSELKLAQSQYDKNTSEICFSATCKSIFCVCFHRFCSSSCMLFI